MTIIASGTVSRMESRCASRAKRSCSRQLQVGNVAVDDRDKGVFRIAPQRPFGRDRAALPIAAVVDDFARPFAAIRQLSSRYPRGRAEIRCAAIGATTVRWPHGLGSHRGAPSLAPRNGSCRPGCEPWQTHARARGSPGAASRLTANVPDRPWNKPTMPARPWAVPRQRLADLRQPLSTTGYSP